MPTFEIEQYELHAQRFRVEADSPAHAIKQLFDGGAAEAVDNSLDLIEVATDHGLPIEDFPELADELRRLGESLDDDFIPSIRWIEQVD